VGEKVNFMKTESMRAWFAGSPVHTSTGSMFSSPVHANSGTVFSAVIDTLETNTRAARDAYARGGSMQGGETQGGAQGLASQGVGEGHHGTVASEWLGDSGESRDDCKPGRTSAAKSYANNDSSMLGTALGGRNTKVLYSTLYCTILHCTVLHSY
jgi:hypothetical protein